MKSVMEKKRYYAKSILSFMLVLFAMPLGHAAMIIMEKTMEPTTLHYSAFFLGLFGLIVTVVGVFAKGGTRQTLYGLFGGLFFWTGWVEFLFKYYADRFGVQPLIENGEVVTKPEYLILPASFGFFMMFMVLYVFSLRTGCNFINWIQKHILRQKRDIIVATPVTRHIAIVTFEEINLILWASYLLLMFCYDNNFIGDHSPVTMAVGAVCLVGSFFIFKKQLRLSSWGANIRMAIPTVIVFWVPVEILGRLNFFNEFWVEPQKHVMEMSFILIAFLVFLAFPVVKSLKGKHS
jgi:hypothetical protein